MSEVRQIEIKKIRGRLALFDKESGQPLGGQVAVNVVSKPDDESDVIVTFRFGSEDVTLA